MKTIVAATDFSKVSMNAVNYAASMADYLKVSLGILHVCELPLVATEVPFPAYDIEPVLHAAEQDIKSLAAELKNKIPGLQEITTEIRIGSVIDQLNDYCAGLPVYAVIMGINGANATERFLFGSKTIWAMKQVDLPLIVVPPGVVFTAIKNTGLACDFKQASESIPLQEIKKIIKEFNSTLHILHIKEKNRTALEEGKLDEFSRFRDLVKDLEPVYHVLYNDDIEEGISKLVKRDKIDLLIVIPGKHNFLEKLFHKSHSKELALHTQVPVLSIHQ